MSKIYFKVSLVHDPNGGYIDTPEGLKTFIDSLVEEGEGGEMDAFIIEPVAMTEEEFDSLPEFQGF